MHSGEHEADWAFLLGWFGSPGSDLKAIGPNGGAGIEVRQRMRRGKSMILLGHRYAAAQIAFGSFPVAAADVGLPPPGAVLAEERPGSSVHDRLTLAARLTSVLRLGDAIACVRAARRDARQDPVACGALGLIEGELQGLLGRHRIAAETLAAAAAELDGTAPELAQIGLERALRQVSAEPSAWVALRAYEHSLSELGDVHGLIDRAARGGDTVGLGLSRALLELAEDPGAALACLPPPRRDLEESAPDLIAAELVRAEAMKRLGRRKDALQHLTRLSLPVEGTWWSSQRDAHIAEIAAGSGDERAAARAAERSMNAADAVRGRVGSELQRAAWLLPRRAGYDVALRLAVADGELERCLEIADRARGAEFARTVSARALSGQGGIGERVAEAFDALVERADTAAGVDRDAVRTLRADHTRLAGALAPRSVSEATLRRLGARIGPFAVLCLHEVEAGEGFRVLATDQGVAMADRYTLGKDEVALISRLAALEGIDDLRWLDADGAPDVRRLGQSLLPNELVELADGRPLAISPPASLRALPWAALELDDASLVERFAVVQWPSIAFAAELEPVERPAQRRLQAALSGDPERKLRGVREQVELLRALWGERLVPIAAGESPADTLFRYSQSGQLAAADTLLVIGHGAAHPVEPLASGLVLDDGVTLTAAAILALRVPASVELWTCRSDGVYPVAGEEQIGVVASLLMSGADRVLTMSWAVRDVAMPIVAERVHVHRQRGEGLAAALARAQRESIDDLPFSSWAAPQVVGLPTRA